MQPPREPFRLVSREVCIRIYPRGKRGSTREKRTLGVGSRSERIVSRRRASPFPLLFRTLFASSLFKREKERE